MSKEIFSKFIPNVKLGTRFDAEGNEIDVEIREDTEASECRTKIFDLLLSAGYFRVMIKNLSDFDKLIGGISFLVDHHCIEACNFDVDVDLLFNENLSIGQKIALVERVVRVLPIMKCPFTLEPHQIQGLDYINIIPVIQWLVKESVDLRNIKAESLQAFAISQFHNQFSLRSSAETRVQREKALNYVKRLEVLYTTKRLFKRKLNIEPEDEKSRVRLTLLEYGIKNIGRLSAKSTQFGTENNENEGISEKVELDKDEIDEQILSENLAIVKEEVYHYEILTEEERMEISRCYENLKMEMLLTSSHELSEQNKVKNLETIALALEKRCKRIVDENEILAKEVHKDCDEYESLKLENENLSREMQRLETQEQETDETLKTHIKNLILENEKVKQEEALFKASCAKVIEELHRKIEEAESVAILPDESSAKYEEILAKEKESLRLCRLQLAKKNRTVISLQRQLDVPDGIELSQYQKRFYEIYNNMNDKHKETKQFYALYNTLNDTHLYLEKELTLLNSIHDTYPQAMTTPHSKEQFIKKFEDVTDGVKTAKEKIKRKNDDEKSKRDHLNTELLRFIELQRKYTAMIKQFKITCENHP